MSPWKAGGLGETLYFQTRSCRNCSTSRTRGSLRLDLVQSSLRMLVPLANIQGIVPEKYWTAKPKPNTSVSPEGDRLVSFSAMRRKSSLVHSFLGGWIPSFSSIFVL